MSAHHLGRAQRRQHISIGCSSVSAMEVAAFVTSVFALLIACWAAWATHRQATAAETQAAAAQDANATATEALELAHAADARERSRQDLEDRPTFDVTGKRERNAPTIVRLTLLNAGPLTYDSVSAQPDLTDPETASLLLGIGDPADPQASIQWTTVKAGETVSTSLRRKSVEVAGSAKLIVTATRSDREWTSVHYVAITRPPRMITM